MAVLPPRRRDDVPWERRGDDRPVARHWVWREDGDRVRVSVCVFTL
jgi:hypothetical protein